MAAPISRAAVGGDVEQADVDGGHAEEEGRAEIEKLGGGLLMLEAFEQAHAAAAGEPAVQTVAERVHVKQGQGEQEAVGRGDLPAGEQGDGVGGEVVVGEDRAFGCAGGAGGVDDAGRGIAIQRRRRGGREGMAAASAVSSAGVQTGTGAANGSVETTARARRRAGCGRARDRDRGC